MIAVVKKGKKASHRLPIRLMRYERRPNIVRGLEDLCVSVKTHLSNPASVMYEIGSYAGESAEIFSRYFTEVHCVEPFSGYLGGEAAEFSWQEVRESFSMRAKKAGNIFLHEGYSRQIAKEVPDESLDFVYIDADHSYEHVREDILAWHPKVHVAGWLGGHDYTLFNQGVVKAVADNFVFPPGHSPYLFLDGSWLVQKTAARASG
jgi:hypothetical protein